MQNGKSLCFAALLILFLSAAEMRAQNISGTVTDAFGAPVRNATVTIKNREAEVIQTATTDLTGSYHVSGLALGAYTLTVSAAGFPEVSQEITLRAGLASRNIFDFRLNSPTLGASGLPGQVRNDYVPCIFPQSFASAFAHGQQPPPPLPAEAKTLNLGCSQSILTWKETSDIFGRRIADTYVAIQVVVRNLDSDHEFLLHDVQIAVDFNAASARYISGRDKVLVRGVAIKGQAFDRRNFLLHVAEVIGDIAGASSIAFTSIDFKNGVSVFRSAFLPGLGRIFPDFTIDQLNRLNDTGFSANSAYKIVVAKNGSVPFVTFMPADIYAKGYKKYREDQLRGLSDKTLVVFSGVHITEAVQQASLSRISCPLSAEGFLDLTSTATQLQCTLTGENLGALARIRLVNTVDPAVIADGSVSTTGTVSFDAGDLKKLKNANYRVDTIDNLGKERSTDLTVKIRQP